MRFFQETSDEKTYIENMSDEGDIDIESDVSVFVASSPPRLLLRFVNINLAAASIRIMIFLYFFLF